VDLVVDEGAERPGGTPPGQSTRSFSWLRQSRAVAHAGSVVVVGPAGVVIVVAPPPGVVVVVGVEPGSVVVVEVVGSSGAATNDHRGATAPHGSRHPAVEDAM